MSRYYKPFPANFTLAELERMFYVDQLGNVMNKISVKRAKAGEVAGSIGLNGYRIVWFKRKRRYAHHIAWMLYYGEWPDSQLDHVNGIKTDNRKENLRKTTQSLNMKNVRMKSNNKSGVSGYVKEEVKSRYWVIHFENGRQKRKHLKQKRWQMII